MTAVAPVVVDVDTTKPRFKHLYEPWGSALELFKRRDPEVLISGPAGTGKSRACLEKMHAMCLLNPGMRGLIVRKTLTSLSSTALETFRKYVATEAFKAGDVEFYGGSAQEPAQYRYGNGSVIVVGGMDRPSRIMSSEYDLIYVQEATELTEEDWEALTTRLRNGRVSFQQIIADCNPAHPTHWLKRRCDIGRTVMLTSTHQENPTLFRKDGSITAAGQAYMQKLENLTGVRRLRLLMGLWAAAEGIIYDNLDENIHIIEPFTIPEDWERYWSVDFGFTNPFVLQCWAEDPDGRLYLYKEFYETGRTTKEMAEQIKADPEWKGPKPAAIVCDHDAEGRTVLEQELKLKTLPAHKAVSEGIQAVQDRLKVAADGKPRIFLFRNAVVKRDQKLLDDKKPTSTIEEIPGYIWKADKEAPVKENDHGCDAMRYVVAHRDLVRQYAVGRGMRRPGSKS